MLNPQQSIVKELEEKCRDKFIPFSVTLELTYHCNLSCRHCYVVDNKRKELTLDKIKSIIDELVRLGTFYLSYTGGEIFTRPDLFDILQYAKDRGFFQVLLTNGSLITQEAANFLKKIKPQGVEISLLGATPDTHDSITGVPGSFEKALNAIKMLREADIFIYAKTTLMKSNISEYSRIKSLVERLGAYPQISSSIIPKTDGAIDPQQHKISWEDRLRFLGDETLDDSFLSLIEQDQRGNLTCKAGKMLASINPYGDLCPCNILPIKLGNLHDKSFKDIWFDPDNAVLNELRSLKESDIEKCFSCSLKHLCGRCAGAVYLEHKNLRSPSSPACEDAKWRKHLLLKKEENR